MNATLIQKMPYNLLITSWNQLNECRYKFLVISNGSLLHSFSSSYTSKSLTLLLERRNQSVLARSPLKDRRIPSSSYFNDSISPTYGHHCNSKSASSTITTFRSSTMYSSRTWRSTDSYLSEIVNSHPELLMTFTSFKFMHDVATSSLKRSHYVPLLQGYITNSASTCDDFIYNKHMKLNMLKIPKKKSEMLTCKT